MSEHQRTESEHQHSERDRMPEEERDPAGSAPRKGRLRRLVSGRPGVAVVGAVVGALLAGGTMAWRAGELPFLPRNMCWGALSPDTAGRLFPDGEIRAEELPLHSPGSDGESRSECRLQRWKDDELRSQAAAEVRRLDPYHGRGVREWTREFLSPAMVPLGGETPGMVSDTRAWVALPESCTGGTDDDPPTVVSLSYGPLDSGGIASAAERRGKRAALADAVVELANGVLAERRCQGRYPKPGTLHPQAGTRTLKQHGTEKLCGLRDTKLPSWLRGSREYPNAVRATTDISGPAHSCEYGRHLSTDATRFTTIEDPHLANFVLPLGYRTSVRLRGDGFGSVSGDMSIYIATCQTGPVAFLVQQEDFLDEHHPMTELLPAYVAAEAKRIGCGKVRVPEPKMSGQDSSER
ncbi:hypothetical protein ITI46_33010 [Streptomyces oryzae]|uniref:Secreted protein n=1 Tax=Streptomyces oryzae TaxID=1434886 RepID=A0ABS3XM84_9ACTN|nr:hypothetical protein [Streptomyces oryzae]MBO8196420.1 hypothetical protein [Streptomyces oryzae]